MEFDERNRITPVGRSPASVRVDARPIFELPVPHAEEPVWQLHLEPQPEGTPSMVAYAPRVIALAPPLFDLVGRPTDCIRSVVGPGLKHVALVPDQFVTGAQGATPQPVGFGSGAEGQVHAERALFRVSPDADLLVGLEDLYPRAGYLGRVRITVEWS